MTPATLYRAVQCGLLLSTVSGQAGAQDRETPVPGVVIYHPRVHQTVDTVYYRVQGRTAEDLRADMMRKGPIDVGSRHVANYVSSFTYTYEFQRRPSACSAQVKIELKSTFNMPTWDGVAGADPNLRASWIRFNQYLGVHEQGHRMIATRFTDLMRYKAEQVVLPACEGLPQQIKAVMNDVNRQATEAQATYDAQTDHGVKQGARWPPQ